jgi:hypothetical protein
VTLALTFLLGLWVGAVGLCVALRIELRRRRGVSLFPARELVNALKGELR